mmetsp:Transcript_1916/g.3921  ORF Transcript_1916/g.3921 Transcript_1916/m.3921 type:complete len:178 (-) Transcript_1916:14-547(-)
MRFSAETSAPSTQTCPSCRAVFDRDLCVKRLAEAEAANADFRTSQASPQTFASARAALAASWGDGSGSGLPPHHEQSLLLLRNLAACHRSLAAAEQGLEHPQSSGLSVELACRYLSLHEAAFGRKTSQRDKGYLHCLHQLLSGAGPELQERSRWQEKLERACLLQFGQRELPESLRD